MPAQSITIPVDFRKYCISDVAYLLAIHHGPWGSGAVTLLIASQPSGAFTCPSTQPDHRDRNTDRKRGLIKMQENISVQGIASLSQNGFGVHMYVFMLT